MIPPTNNRPDRQNWQVALKSGPRHLARIALILFWRKFPWLGGRGKYWFRRVIAGFVTPDAPSPMMTDAGWLVLLPERDALQSGLYWYGRHYEGEVVEVLEARVQPGQRVIDIGAHVGYYTLLLARRVGRAGLVVAFEPLAGLCEQLRRGLSLNRIDWVWIEPLALAATGGRMTLYQPEDPGQTSAAASVLAGSPHAASVDVRAVSLDDYVKEKNLGPVSLIKCDAEGGEWLILQGMARLLEASDAPELLLEIHPDQIRSLGGSAEQIMDLLGHDYGYSLYWIDLKDGPRPLPRQLPERSAWHLFATKRRL